MTERMNIEAERARLKLSKERLSEMLGITSKTYLSYVRGGVMPIDKAIEMSEMFGCSLDCMAGLTDQQNRAC